MVGATNVANETKEFKPAQSFRLLGRFGAASGVKGTKELATEAELPIAVTRCLAARCLEPQPRWATFNAEVVGGNDAATILGRRVLGSCQAVRRRCQSRRLVIARFQSLRARYARVVNPRMRQGDPYWPYSSW